MKMKSRESKIIVNLLRDIVYLKEIESSTLEMSKKLGYEVMEDGGGCITDTIANIALLINHYTGIDVEKIVEVDANTLNDLVKTILNK